MNKFEVNLDPFKVEVLGKINPFLAFTTLCFTFIIRLLPLWVILLLLMYNQLGTLDAKLLEIVLKNCGF